jgi:ABC-type multidrug transport system fused ATPase/permease subunit
MRLYLRAISYFRPDWPLILVWLGLIGLSTGIGLLAAWPMAVLIDSVLGGQGGNDFIHRFFLSLLPAGQIGRIVGLSLIGLSLKIVQELTNTGQTIVSNHINYSGLVRVRCDLYRKLQALCIGYHRSQPQGDAIYRLSIDTFGCQTIVGVLVNTVVAGGTLLAITLVLAARSPSLTLLAFSSAPVLAAANVTFGRRFRERSLECRVRESQFTTAVQQSMACVGLVQSCGQEAQEFTRFHGTVIETVKAWWRLNWQQMAYNLIVGACFGIGGALIFGYGGYLVYRDQHLHPVPGGMTVGDLVVFTSYLAMLWGPLCSITGFFYNVQNGVVGAQRVFEVLDRDPSIADKPGALPLPRMPRRLELDRITFSYNGGNPVLRDIRVRVEPGEMVAFVGSSGVGKSTLLNLLPRFYDPTGGAILLDGIDARDVKVADLRRHVALVLQENVILPTTIAENIAYGRPGATLDEVRRAAALAGADEFIEKLPLGYDSPAAEGGQNFSGGQRQRIAIARALLTQAPFIVLDEPTSSLDPLHERHITDTLRRLKGHRTIIIVSHRLSTVVNCDRIYVMEGGAVVETGTHLELLARGGLYAEMATQQDLDIPVAAHAA